MLCSFAVVNTDNWSEVYEQGKELTPIMDEYLDLLKEFATVNEPRGIIFHDFDSATKVFSDHPLPAWTNSELIHVDPLVKDWKRIFLSAISNSDSSNVKTEVSNYYESLDIRDIATIVGHEVTHHLGYFERTFDHEINDSAWFEEGLCFYIPRKKLLSNHRFESVMHVEALLTDLYKNQFGSHPIWQFGNSNDESSFVSALFDYWRATAVVRVLIEDYAKGDTAKVLNLYEFWSHHVIDKRRFFDYVIESLNVPKNHKDKLEFS